MSDEQNPLEMSDEEIMNMAEPEPVLEETEEETETIEEEIDVESEKPATSETESTEPEQQEETENTATEEHNTESATEDEVDTELTASEDSTTNTEEEVDNTVDFQAEYNKLLTPFNASGKQVQVSNVDEAIRLMQMGADYNKKMTGLKPSMKILKMLENNNLLDEDKLNYLIDLDKKDPDAIVKLMKDGGIDPLEVDVNADTEYKPNTYTVDDKVVELDGVLAEIKHTDSYASTIDIISNKWDEASKEELYKQPALIGAINNQVGSGDYEQIDSIVQNQRMLGNLNGLSDILAYKQVGDYLHNNGQLVSQQTQQQPQQHVTAPPQVNTNNNPKLKNRKKAASTTKTAPSTTSKQKYNPLAMSDEEFEKVSTPQF